MDGLAGTSAHETYLRDFLEKFIAMQMLSKLVAFMKFQVSFSPFESVVSEINQFVPLFLFFRARINIILQ
jgi:hypothetical protein